MANTIQDGTTKQHWMPEVQRELDKSLVALPISDVYRGADRVIHNPYGSTPSGSDGAAATAYSVEDFEITDDTLTVSRRAVAAEHIDNIEQLQQRFDLAMQRARRQAYTVSNKIDKYMLNLPVSLSGVNDIDDGDFAGTAGNPYVTSNTTIDDVANKITEMVGLANGAMERGMFWVVSPYEVTDITSLRQNNGFATADRALENGFVGTTFSGLEIYKSNNLTHSVVGTFTGVPSDGDTLTIGDGRSTITLTFVATLSGGAGEIHIPSTVDLLVATLEEYLDAFGANDEAESATAGYSALSVANQKILKELGMVADSSTADDTFTMTTKGTLVVSESVANFTFGTVGRHTIAGVKGSMQLAMPADGMEFEKKSVSQKHGKEVVTSQIYNGTIWNNLKPEIYDVYLG